MRTGIADLPLHYGACPRWLFNKMVLLTQAISRVILEEYGALEFLKRLSNPYFFHALTCVIGFDWNSSGTTTTACGALKQALASNPDLMVCGGKGAASRKTPEELKEDKFGLGEEKISKLARASKLCAKVDNALIQDGYHLYHHTFIHDKDGNWVVIQQGMNDSYARRYLWFSKDVKTFTLEPNNKICCDKVHNSILNMADKICKDAQQTCVDLICDNPFHLLKYFKLPEHHKVLKIDISKRGWEVLKKAYELQPRNYEELIAINGMGPKKIRALALISNLIYGNELSWRDPVKYSYAHGGKDGFPYPVNKKVYDNSIRFLRETLEKTSVSSKLKRQALRGLHKFL